MSCSQLWAPATLQGLRLVLPLISEWFVFTKDGEGKLLSEYGCSLLKEVLQSIQAMCPRVSDVSSTRCCK
jgi:hypothetical protein